METIVDGVRAGYDAFNRRDADAILALLDPAITYRMPLDPAGRYPTFSGLDGVRRFYEAIWASFRRIEAHVRDARALREDLVVVSGWMEAEVAGRRPVEFGFTHFWTIEGDRAVAVSFHDAANPFELLAEQGAEPPPEGAPGP